MELVGDVYVAQYIRACNRIEAGIEFVTDKLNILFLLLRCCCYVLPLSLSSSSVSGLVSDLDLLAASVGR
jgi:hypothetical protein